MEEKLLKNRISEDTNPALLERHIKQLHANPESRLLYHIQVHETYMYTYFRNVPLSSTSLISVNEIKGHAVGVIDHGNITLVRPVDEKYFYSTLLCAPHPFFFVPSVELAKIKGFCEGAFSIESMGRHGILMDIDFACKVGIEFIGLSYLISGEVKKYYIGLIYEK
ncbi:hypothetical protein PAEPH01_0211 [Pancytospora epiphaga]|nr:hypothetical protein PAEPH01_0211 [Pancytospora epiphaga]